jgi:hypothetical protein
MNGHFNVRTCPIVKEVVHVSPTTVLSLLADGSRQNTSDLDFDVELAQTGKPKVSTKPGETVCY